jgi:hypothetical protein
MNHDGNMINAKEIGKERNIIEQEKVASPKKTL